MEKGGIAMAGARRIVVADGEPKPSSPLVPIMIAVVLIGASLAALYYAGFFSTKVTKKEYVCWNGQVVESAGECPAQPAPYCPSPTACPTAAAVVTEQDVKTATQTGKQAIATPVFKVVDFKASGGILSLMLEYNAKPTRASSIGVSGITTTNDTSAVRPTGDWENSTTLNNVGDRSPWLYVEDYSLSAKEPGDDFSLTVSIYYGGGLVELWVLKGKVE